MWGRTAADTLRRARPAALLDAPEHRPGRKERRRIASPDASPACGFRMTAARLATDIGKERESTAITERPAGCDDAVSPLRLCLIAVEVGEARGNLFTPQLEQPPDQREPFSMRR